MKSLILPYSLLVKISVLSLLFFVTAAPSIIDNTRAVGLQEQENNVAEGHHSDDLSSPKKSLGVESTFGDGDGKHEVSDPRKTTSKLICLPSCQVDGVCMPSCTKSEKPSHESTFGDGDGKHEVSDLKKTTSKLICLPSCQGQTHVTCEPGCLKPKKKEPKSKL